MNDGQQTEQTTAGGDAEEPGSLGDPRVDAAVAELRDLDEAGVDEHAERYEQAHDALRAALDDDGAPAAPPTPTDPA